MVPQKVQIPGWPYYLTIDGEVFREGKKDPVKKQFRKGCAYVSLYNGKRKKRAFLSKLMRELYFNGTTLPLKHINGSHMDYSFWNLKPIHPKELTMYGRTTGNRGKSVVETLPDGTENIYPSAAACAKALHYTANAVTRWCRGECNSTNGNKYRWEE